MLHARIAGSPVLNVALRRLCNGIDRFDRRPFHKPGYDKAHKSSDGNSRGNIPDQKSQHVMRHFIQREICQDVASGPAALISDRDSHCADPGIYSPDIAVMRYSRSIPAKKYVQFLFVNALPITGHFDISVPCIRIHYVYQSRGVPVIDCIIDVIHIVEPRKIIQDLIHSLIIPVFRDHAKIVMICI